METGQKIVQKGGKKGAKRGNVGTHAEMTVQKGCKRVLKGGKKGAKRRQKGGKKGASTEQSMTALYPGKAAIEESGDNIPLTFLNCVSRCNSINCLIIGTSVSLLLTIVSIFFNKRFTHQ